jgi:hypothetical protein
MHALSILATAPMRPIRFPRRTTHIAVLAFAFGLAISTTAVAKSPMALPVGATWQKLQTEPYKGKQDDIHFIDADHGWYVNGAGKIFATADGGKTWTLQLEQPGTYFRTVGFVDADNGFAGNIGIDYFPGVTDTRPLYRTRDGGKTWSVVESLTGEQVKGLCAIDVLHNRFVNAGKLDTRVVIHAGGRVGGPATLLRSLDGGDHWKIIDMTPHTAMILDVKFFDAMNGVVFGASDSDVEKSHARIVRTQDGGVTWKTVYESKRPFEITWKGSFPSAKVGYATVQSYDPDPASHPALRREDHRRRPHLEGAAAGRRREGARVRHRLPRRTHRLGRHQHHRFPDRGRRQILDAGGDGPRGEQDPRAADRHRLRRLCDRRGCLQIRRDPARQ